MSDDNKNEYKDPDSSTERDTLLSKRKISSTRASKSKAKCPSSTKMHVAGALTWEEQKREQEELEREAEA